MLLHLHLRKCQDGIKTISLGPGLDLYAHNLGEDNSTVIG